MEREREGRREREMEEGAEVRGREGRREGGREREEVR